MAAVKSAAEVIILGNTGTKTACKGELYVFDDDQLSKTNYDRAQCRASCDSRNLQCCVSFPGWYILHDFSI
jgi:hypothetical protein